MEQLSNFGFVWEKWVKPLANGLFDQVDEDFRENTGLTIRDMDSLKNDAEVFFKAKRAELKKEYYGNNFSHLPRCMDFHKLSAVLCSTLMKYKIFDFNISICRRMIKSIDEQNVDWLVKNALINFRLAFYASVVFLYQSMLFKYKDNEDLFKKLKDNHSLNLYENHNKNIFSEVCVSDDSKKVHESFENSVVLDLAKRNIKNKSFDLLLYSTIMYQLEEYNIAYYTYMSL